MKVIVDAQLPQSLARFLSYHNVDARHTLDLPEKNATTDSKIIQIAEQENRVVISKDSDFLDSFILDGRPPRLLIVSTGNINNQTLIQLFEDNIELLKSLFTEHAVVEIDEQEIQVHY